MKAGIFAGIFKMSAIFILAGGVLVSVASQATAVAPVDRQNRPENVQKIVQKAGEAKLGLAQTLIEALDAGYVCDTDAYPGEINQLVSSASVQLDASVIQAWAAKLPATSKIRKDFAFRQAVKEVYLLHKKVSKADVETQLLGTQFFGFGSGVYGSGRNVTFLAGGIAEIKTLRLLENEPYTDWVPSQGTWEVVIEKPRFGGESAILKLDGQIYKIEGQGHGEIWLIPDGATEEQTFEKTLSTSDSYCSA